MEITEREFEIKPEKEGWHICRVCNLSTYGKRAVLTFTTEIHKSKRNMMNELFFPKFRGDDIVIDAKFIDANISSEKDQRVIDFCQKNLKPEFELIVEVK